MRFRWIIQARSLRILCPLIFWTLYILCFCYCRSAKFAFRVNVQWVAVSQLLFVTRHSKRFAHSFLRSLMHCVCTEIPEIPLHSFGSGHHRSAGASPASTSLRQVGWLVAFFWPKPNASLGRSNQPVRGRRPAFSGFLSTSASVADVNSSGAPAPTSPEGREVG